MFQAVDPLDNALVHADGCVRGFTFRCAPVAAAEPLIHRDGIGSYVISAQTRQFADPQPRIDGDARHRSIWFGNQLHGAAHILRSETLTRNHWLILKLVGHRSNRDAIGAEVKLTTSKGIQFQPGTTAGGYLSSSDKRVHFGLGAEGVAKVEIRWPSGIVQALDAVPADQILQVDELLRGEVSHGTAKR